MKDPRITKAEILRNTTSRELKTGVFGRHFEHVCRIDKKVFIVKTQEAKVFLEGEKHHVQHICDASNKKEFINKIYVYLNL